MKTVALLKGKKQSRTAIIIKDHVIRYVQAKRPDLESLQIYGERYLPLGVIRDGKIIEQETLEAILSECVEAWKIKKHLVQFIVPNAYTILRTIQVPLNIKKDEIKGYLYTVIGETIHLPFENPAFDIHDLGERDGQRDILLIAAPETTVQQFYDLLHSVKLKPNAADISSLCFYRLFHMLDRDNNSDHFLTVQLDILTMNITIFHDQKPVFMRNIKLTIEEDKWNLLNDVEDGIVWAGDPTELEGQAQDILTEIERIINFYRFSINQGKQGVTSMIITGDHPYLEEIAAKCNETFDISVQTIKSEDIVTTNRDQVPTRFHEVVGLALKKEVHDAS